MVEEELQPSQNCLIAAANQGGQVRRTKKTVPVDEPEDEAVAVGQFDGENRRRALEPVKTGGIHSGRIPEAESVAEASGFACKGKCYSPVIGLASRFEQHARHRKPRRSRRR